MAFLRVVYTPTDANMMTIAAAIPKRKLRRSSPERIDRCVVPAGDCIFFHIAAFSFRVTERSM